MYSAQANRCFTKHGNRMVHAINCISIIYKFPGQIYNSMSLCLCIIFNLRDEFMENSSLNNFVLWTILKNL